MEIERKFLISEDISDKAVYNIEEIEQGYIKFNPEVRIRNVDNREFYLTYKSKGKLQRQELEERITKEQYQILLKIVKGRLIKKTRFYIKLDEELSAEVDVYGEELEGLSTVETEFKSVTGAQSFKVPTWYGAEVTDDNRFKNQSLAKLSQEEIQKLLTKTIPKKNTKTLKR